MKNAEEQADLLDKAMKDAASNSTFGMNDATTATRLHDKEKCRASWV